MTNINSSTTTTTTSTGSRRARKAKRKPGAKETKLPVAEERRANRVLGWEQFASEGLPTAVAVRLEQFMDSGAVARVEAVAEEISDRLAIGIEPSRMIEQFLSATDDITSRRDRFAALRALELLIPLSTEALERPSWVGERNERRRPLSAIELGVVRMCALTKPKSLVPVGLLDAGCVSGELVSIHAGNFNRGHDRRIVTVDAPGTTRSSLSGYPPADPRRLLIPDWCAAAIGKRVDALPVDTTVAYYGSRTEPAKAEASVLMNVHSVLVMAGLGSDRTVTPLSIRNGAARLVYLQHGLEAAFEMLGHQNMSLMASEIGRSPQRPCRQPRR